MRYFKDWLKEQNLFKTPNDPRTTIERMSAFVSAMEPKDIEETKDLLMRFRKELDHALSGGM